MNLYHITKTELDLQPLNVLCLEIKPECIFVLDIFYENVPSF